MRHAHWMDFALTEAREAGAAGEVPVGAALVCDGAVVARAGNTREAAADPLGHAELSVLRAAATALGRWRLAGCTLYVTLEPCPMCAAAAVQARVDRIVFGAQDPRLGACGSVWSLAQAPEWHHRVEIVGGVREQEAAELLREFFAGRRS
ncbi:MAG: nucleoside deaminase [Candidatus Sericytochromatia bacterium]|nr:nucleoside deaminase [Candidatus Tanganyikabacteria bacterium]